MKPILDIIDGDTPINRGYAVSMTVKSFKGRRDVEVHLFRPEWSDSESETIDTKQLFGPPIMEDVKINPDKDKQIILESFTKGERDAVIKYLMEHYSSRLSRITSTPMEFPIPSGLPPLSGITEGKDIGLIKFEKVPHFDLPFALRGMYNLGVHKPLVETSDK
jgi:hypothetical protein